MSEENINGLCEFILEKPINVLSPVNIEGPFKSADDILNFKFDLVKVCVSKQLRFSSYKDCFNDDLTQYQQKIEKLELHKNLYGNVDNGYKQLLILLFNTKLTQDFDYNGKISLKDIQDAINNKTVLSPDNNFIKICKGIYKFTYGLSSNEAGQILGAILNIFVNKVDRWAKDTGNLTDVLTKIQDIQCNDEEFNNFKNTYRFNAEEKAFKVKYFNVLEQNSYSSFDELNSENKSNKTSEEKISTKKLFLLIATVIFLAAMIFFTINLILAFLAISQTLAIILAAIATIALVIFLAIGIKNDVINKPTCLGGEKSFIDLYQNKGERKEEPEPYKGIEEYENEFDDDSEK